MNPRTLVGTPINDARGHWVHFFICPKRNPASNRLVFKTALSGNAGSPGVRFVRTCQRTALATLLPEFRRRLGCGGEFGFTGKLKLASLKLWNIPCTLAESPSSAPSLVRCSCLTTARQSGRYMRHAGNAGPLYSTTWLELPRVTFLSRLRCSYSIERRRFSASAA